MHHSQQLCSTLSVGLLQKQLNISQWVTTVTYTQQMDSQCLYPVFLEAQLQAIVQLSRHHFTFQCSMFNAFQDLKIVVSFHKLHKGKAVLNMNTNQFQKKAKDGQLCFGLTHVSVLVLDRSFTAMKFMVLHLLLLVLFWCCSSL